MKIMTFRVDGELHAMELSMVTAVVRAEEVAGEAEWSALPRVDLGEMLGYGATGSQAGQAGAVPGAGDIPGQGDRRTVLIIRGAGHGAVVRVESPGEVLEVPSTALRPAPYLFGSRILRGVIAHGERLLPLLDGGVLAEEASGRLEQPGRLPVR